MKKLPIIFSLFKSDVLANSIQTKCGYEMGELQQHEFPDEETLIRIGSDVSGRELIFVASLDRPNSKILPLLFAVQTARSLGASRIILVAPYLPYMRQDKVFEAGQGITSIYFARLLSRYFDCLVTIDPHLHRWPDLNAIYEIPTRVLHAADTIAHWIENHVKKPILIGPDAESAQWVEGIAKKAKAAFIILEKQRKGDSLINVSLPDMTAYEELTPVLVDDIISTGMTMLETVQHLQSLKMPMPVCIAIHAIFAAEAYQTFVDRGVNAIITCNTLPHASNHIDISQVIVDCLREIVRH